MTSSTAEYTPEQRARYDEMHAKMARLPLDAQAIEAQAHWHAMGYAPPKISIPDVAAPADDPAPINLLRPLAAPRMRAADAPPVLAAFAEVHARATGFDPSIMLAGGIVAAAAALSDEVRLCVAPRSGWFESARLWAVVIGGPGAGKSPGLRLAQAPLFALHRELVGEWSRQRGADSAGDTAEQSDAPPRPALFTSDATVEALTEVLRTNPRGILYTVDELSSWIGAHDTYRNGGGKDRGEWLRLYDGGPHQVDRVRRGSFFVPNWSASMLSATTPAALRKLAPKLPDDGLLQRILLFVARPRTLPDESTFRVETASASKAWEAVLRNLHELPAAVVHLSGDARAAFDAEQRELHGLTQAFEDAHPSYAAHLAKRPAMLARLALPFPALEAPAVTDNIAGATMARAARFLRQQERHAMSVYADLLGADTGMELAKAMATSILAAQMDSFNRRELAATCRAFRSADEPTRVAALALLSDFGWLTADVATMSHGAQWNVDSRVHMMFAEQGRQARERRAAVRKRLADAHDDVGDAK